MPYTTSVAGTTITASWANANLRDQVVTPFASTSARDAAITSPVEGMLSFQTDNDRFTTYNGSAWVDSLQIGSWFTFTPTLTQNSVAITKTVTEARYCRFGRTVLAQVRLDITGTSTGAGNAFAAGLPVAANASSNRSFGTMVYSDASGGAAGYYYGGANAFGASAVCCVGNASGGSPVGATPSINAANGDYVQYQVMYEAASST